MTDEEIFERIKKVITNHFAIDQVTISFKTSFYEDLNSDSLDIVELILCFEEAFKIDMADDIALQITTVQDMFNYIKLRLEGNFL